MAVVIKIPTWVTFNRIPLGTPAAGLAALNAALGTSLAIGDSNPVWADLQDLDLGGGPLVRGAGLLDLAEVTPLENLSFLSLPQVQLAVVVGGDVLGMPVYFVVADKTAEVPASFPNRTYFVEDPEDPENPTETVHTWETYYDGMPGHDPIEIDGAFWCSSANTWNLGQPLPASAWALSGLTVKMVSELPAPA